MSCNERVKNIHVFSHSKKSPNKFLFSFIEMVEKISGNGENVFFMYGDGDVPANKSIRVFRSKIALLKSLIFERNVKRVIFHSLPVRCLIIYLYYLKISRIKTEKYLVIWGGEIYFKKNDSFKDLVREYFDKKFMALMNGFITHIEEDYLAAKKYCRNGSVGWVYIPSFYPSNVVNEKRGSQSGEIKILIGNSALSRNNHVEIIDYLSSINLSNSIIYIPLSYGDRNYGDFIFNYAKQKISVPIIPLFDFLAYDQYLELLSKIDLAFFANNDQQGVGNITQLLAFGSQVYLKKASVSYKYFSKLGFKVHDIKEFKGDFNRSICFSNISKAREIFSKDKLESSLKFFLKI